MTMNKNQDQVHDNSINIRSRPMLLEINEGSVCVLKLHSMQYPLNGGVNFDASIQSLSGCKVERTWFCMRRNARLPLYLFVGGFYQLLDGIFEPRVGYS